MNRTSWIIFAAACIALLGFLAFSRTPSTPAFEGDPAKVAKSDEVYGKADSKVVFIEYGDFQCPGCGALAPVLKEVKEDYKDSVAFVYRYLPLTNIHPNAKAAAVSAAAAAKQGKFWEMHDKIYENQSEWSEASGNSRSAFFERYAEEIGLDMGQYAADLKDEATRLRVERGLAAARKANIELSTPIVVLNGKNLPLESLQTDGRYDAKKFRTTLNKALENAGLEVPKSNADTSKNSKQ